MPTMGPIETFALVVLGSVVIFAISVFVSACIHGLLRGWGK